MISKRIMIEDGSTIPFDINDISGFDNLGKKIIKSLLHNIKNLVDINTNISNLYQELSEKISTLNKEKKSPLELKNEESEKTDT